MRIALFVVVLTSVSCGGGSASVRAVSEATSERAPAGRYMHDSVDDSGCLDCPTPRFASITRVDLSAVQEIPVRDGYPMLVFPQEVGLTANAPDEVVVVAGMFDSEGAARARTRSREIVGLRWTDPLRFLVRVRRDSDGFPEAAVRETYGNPEASSRQCTLQEGVVSPRADNDVLRIADAPPWIRLPCGETSAYFRVADTDFGLISFANGEEVQDAGGVCGVRHFTRTGRAPTPETLSTARCFDQPASDPWGVCGGDIDQCADRAAAMSDLYRAARLSRYACAWGSERACEVRLDVDLGRGISATTIAGDAIASCRFEQREDAPLHCAKVEELMRRELEPDALEEMNESERGFVAREGCLREIAAWCAVLEASTLCDLDGCG